MVEETVAMEPWEMELCNEMNVTVNKHVRNWGNIVRKLGIQGEDRDGWIKIFKENTDEFLSDIVLDAFQVQESVMQRIEKLLKQYEDLCKKLSLKMPPYGSEPHGLYEEEKLLQVKFVELEEKVKLRTKELTVLYKRESKICKSLGRDSKQLSEYPLPSEDQIDAYMKYIEGIETEKFSREEKFMTIKCEILEIAKELNFKPSLDFEKMVLSEDDSVFAYTDTNMKQLDDFHKSISNQMDYVKQEIISLRESVRSLWEILEEDLQSCDAFLQKYPGNTCDTLDALKLEVKRCELLKKANIEVFVNKYRQEIVLLWGKCRYSPEQRYAFQYFHDELYTEDLLTLHSMEIDKLKRYYDKNSELFELLSKREELWEKKLQLEDKEICSKDRYKNRGGQLLREEKERNALYKRIPKVEEQLLQMAASYEINNGAPFLTFGETIESIIEKSHELHEQDKKVKLSARKQQREMTITPGKSQCLSMAPGSAMKSTTNLTTRTPLASSTKRKIATPLFSAKRPKPLAVSNKKELGYKSAPPKVLLNGKTICKGVPRYSTEKKKRMDRMRRLSKMFQKSKNSTAESGTTAYESFEKELSTKETHRSTLVFHHDGNDTPLAMPLSATPVKIPLPGSTPRRTPRAIQHGSKFSAAPGSNLFL